MDEKTLKENIEITEHLKNLPVLKFFDKEKLDEVLRFSKIQKFNPGDIIIEEGKNDKLVYFLISGTVKVLKHGEEIDSLKGIGDIFGEMCIVDGGPRSASICAADDVVCLVMDVSFRDSLVSDDQIAFCAIFYQVVAEVLAGRLRETSEELVQEQVMKEVLSTRLNQLNKELAQAKEEIARLKS
ncbi:MAG: cyclic nucleotide-binding domain-containing protein [Syntrophales bacterium]